MSVFRRVPPLAVAFALIAAALLAALFTTRKTVEDAFEEARDGEALTVEQGVRADLPDAGPPDAAQLAAILADHAGEGLRYIGVFDARGHELAAAGTAIGPGMHGRHVHVGGRIRVEMRTPYRRSWATGQRPRAIVIEVEPIEADELRRSATWSLALGGIAAVVLLGVAVAVVRRDLRRRAEAEAREREKRLAALGEMSAVLAHEIKNPLASLKGNAQLLASALEEGKPKQKATRVVDEAVRLEKLVADLLAFVRTGELHRARFNPARLIPDAIESDTTEAPATWSLDEARMRQVLANLVENGQAAGGPVTVRVAQEPARAGRATRLVIEVADKGPGVPADDRERIFEPFFTKKTRGTGLGLAIARRIVEQHGGTISVHDGTSGGAVFRIEIPEA
ncbi:MAG TPA: ATP-binding protein [Kofleriaceae bacterium]|nr:ATP-binding protein [Kofleriaceae bacterium]